MGIREFLVQNLTLRDAVFENELSRYLYYSQLYDIWGPCKR